VIWGARENRKDGQCGQPGGDLMVKGGPAQPDESDGEHETDIAAGELARGQLSGCVGPLLLALLVQVGTGLLRDGDGNLIGQSRGNIRHNACLPSLLRLHEGP
jgi:hypothetical protein